MRRKTRRRKLGIKSLKKKFQYYILVEIVSSCHRIVRSTAGHNPYRRPVLSAGSGLHPEGTAALTRPFVHLVGGRLRLRLPVRGLQRPSVLHPRPFASFLQLTSSTEYKKLNGPLSIREQGEANASSNIFEIMSAKIPKCVLEIRYFNRLM